jgi:hypothetical protein
MRLKQSIITTSLLCSFLLVACASDKQEALLPSPSSPASPTIRPTVIPSSTPAPTPDRTATLEAEQAAIVATYTAIVNLCEHTVDVQFSPDGQWVANACVDNDGNPYARVVRYGTSEEWVIPVALPDGVDGYIFPIHWSNDGRALYLTPHVTGQANGLLKLDLDSGAVTEILPFDVQAQGMYSFSFSPDDNSLAYVYNAEPPLKLNILEMATNDLMEIPLDETIANADTIVWSDDETELIFTGKIDKDFVLVWLNLADRSEKIFAAPEKSVIEADHWVDSVTVLVKNRAGDYWLLDLESGEFEETNP